MIKLKDVSKIYNQVAVVDSLTLEVNDGEIFGFIGPNGSGKTTTIKMIMGINRLESGQILVDDIDVYSDPVEAKSKCGFVSDNVDMMLGLTGIQYLNFIANIFNVSMEDRKKRIIELTKTFDIYDRLDETLSSYSHGMRQKIHICGVLLHEPKNWILDEPMTGLDPKAIYTLKEMMKEYAKKGNAVIFSSHVLDIVENLCDKIGIIFKGKLLYLGTPHDLIKQYNNDTLENIFLKITGVK